jgi:glycosyltransferase involved in cell wall biosynthesis
MRIMTLGPGATENTGYGVQQGYLQKILLGLGHEVASASFAAVHGSPILSDGVLTYPSLFANMGQDLACHARHFKADIVIPIMDAWVIEMGAWEGVRLVPFFPVDHSPLSPHLTKRLPQFFASAVYSKWGQEVCREAGFDVAYTPCSVDTQVYAPTDKAEARSALDWPQDRYIVGIVAANVGEGMPSRKAFEVQFRAFKYFQEQHPDALLYLHTFGNSINQTDGENLIRMLNRVGLVVDKDVFFVEQYYYISGMVAPAQMALAYNGMDVLLNVTVKEGFGVPLVEAQACGVPVITGDWTANAELCGAGWLVPRLEAEVYGRTIYDDALYGPLGGYGVMPRVSAIVEALERAYCAQQEGVVYDMEERARSFALNYDVRRVAVEYWKPMLNELERRIAIDSQLGLVRQEQSRRRVKAEEETQREAAPAPVSLPQAVV